MGIRKLLELDVTKLFAQLPKQSRLHQLNASQRSSLLVMLAVYSRWDEDSNSRALDQEARAPKTAAKWMKLAAAELTKVMSGFYGDYLRNEGIDLTKMAYDLESNGDMLELLTKLIGDHKTDNTLLLVEASELIRIATGKYYDDDLSDLYQLFLDAKGTPDEKRKADQALDGASIRKRRNRFRKEQVVYSKLSVAFATNAAGNSPVIDRPFEIGGSTINSREAESVTSAKTQSLRSRQTQKINHRAPKRDD